MCVVVVEYVNTGIQMFCYAPSLRIYTNVNTLKLSQILMFLHDTDIMVQSCVLTCTAALMEGSHSKQISTLIQPFLDSLPSILYSQNIKVRF